MDDTKTCEEVLNDCDRIERELREQLEIYGILKHEE